MTRKEAHAALIRVAGELLHSEELPSPDVADYIQATISVRTIVERAKKCHEINRLRAVAIKEAADTLLLKPEAP